VGFAVLVGNLLANPRIWTWLQTQHLKLFARFGVWWIATIMSFVTLVGYLMNVLKANRLYIYARIEITFGLASCYLALHKTTTQWDFSATMR